MTLQKVLYFYQINTTVEVPTLGHMVQKLHYTLFKDQLKPNYPSISLTKHLWKKLQSLTNYPINDQLRAINGPKKLPGPKMDMISNFGYG